MTSTAPTQSDALVRIVETYVGTPFQHQGRKPGVGLDCAGVLSCAARELGIQVNERTDYRRSPRPDEILAEAARWCAPAVDDGTPGLIYVMATRRSRRASHFAIRADVRRIIHALTGASVCYDSYDRYKDLILSTWKLKG